MQERSQMGFNKERAKTWRMVTPHCFLILLPLVEENIPFCIQTCTLKIIAILSGDLSTAQCTLFIKNDFSLFSNH